VWFIYNTKGDGMPKAVRNTTIRNTTGDIVIKGPGAEGAQSQVETSSPSPKNFWEEQEVLNTAEGKDYVIYLYRLQPATLGHKGYIAKFSTPVTQEEIKETFGGYEYRISLHKGAKWICQDIFSISAPPKAIGSADPAMFAANAGQTGADATAQVSQVLQFVNQRLDKERLEKANDPAYLASLDLVRESAKQAITAAYSVNRNPVAEQAQNSMMTMMMNMLTTMTNTLLQRSLQPPEKTAVSGMREIIDLMGIMGMKVGAGGGARPDALTLIGEKLIDIAPQILEKGAMFMERYNSIARERTIQADYQFRTAQVMRGQQPNAPMPAPQMSSVPPGTPPPNPQQMQSQPAANPGMQTVPFPEGGIPNSQAPVDGAPIEFDGDMVKRRVVELIARGASGDMLMAFISGVNETFAITMQQSSEDLIRSFFAMDPILKQAMQFPNFDQCLSEAIEYLHPEGKPAPANAN
jgi:hypothetical protein